MTGFHDYASAAPCSVRNVCSSQTLHDVAESDSCMRPGMRLRVLQAAELMGLSSFQKPQKPIRHATGPSFASEICSRSTFFHLWEVVQIF